MPIRIRLSLAFTVVFAIAFALGAWLLVSQVSSVIVKSVDSSLALQLTQARRLLPPGSRPAATTGLPSLAPGDYMLQVIDASGHVRAVSQDTSHIPLVTPGQQRVSRHRDITTNSTVDGDPARLMSGPLTGKPGWIAVAAVSLENEDGTISALIRRLAIGGAAFTIIAAIGALLLARSALAPAERMRREAAALSAHDPAGRLPVPRTHDEISALARTINELLGRLHGALARQRAFVADASHELRTPLAVLTTELELAGKPGRSREQLAEAIASASSDAARLSRITDDLLILARSDEDQLTPRMAPTDIGALLHRSADRAGSRLASANVECLIDVAPGLVAAVDPDQIRRAVDNLVDNALRYAPPGSHIRLSAKADGTDLTLEVADEGPGFPSDYLPHAFERFARPDTGRTRADGGAGLGLAIVAAVSRAHGGATNARNRPSGGAVVQLRLPRAVRA